jgi:hypothetical protein
VERNCVGRSSPSGELCGGGVFNASSLAYCRDVLSAFHYLSNGFVDPSERVACPARAMALSASLRISLSVAFFGVLAFVLGVIVENKKENPFSCYMSTDHYAFLFSSPSMVNPARV